LDKVEKFANMTRDPRDAVRITRVASTAYELAGTLSIMRKYGVFEGVKGS